MTDKTEAQAAKKARPGRALGSRRTSVLTPLMAIITALVVGGILIVVTDMTVIDAFTRVPRRIAVPFTDPETEMSLEEAQWRFGTLVEVGNVVDVDGKPKRVVDTVRDEKKEIGLEGARALYPELAPGVTVHLTFIQQPMVGLRAAWNSVATAYAALFEGAIGNPAEMVRALASWFKGDGSLLADAFYPLTESLVTSTPYILMGLAVAVGFRAGLFNVGAEGQYFIGGLAAVYVAYSVKGLPSYIHIPLCLLAALVGGGLWGTIPGLLKAKTGAHEVINTIMMNYIAFALSDWLLNGPMKRPGGFRPVSPEIQPSAYLHQFFPSPMRFHVGFFIALLAAVLVWWLLFKTTIGFELRTVGANSRAAKYAGMNLTWNFCLAMFLSGGLAGIAAANDIMGLIHYMPNAFSAGYGFDSIALALLGRSHPVGVVLAALLFGTLRAGATRMQSVAQIPIDIISILQALIIIFIAAPEIIHAIYPFTRRDGNDQVAFGGGWSK